MFNFGIISAIVEASATIGGIVYMVITRIKDNRKHKITMAEIRRQNSRIEAAYYLHRYVMKTYGFEYTKLLPKPDQIIIDDKPITLFNYLDL